MTTLSCLGLGPNVVGVSSARTKLILRVMIIMHYLLHTYNYHIYIVIWIEIVS